MDSFPSSWIITPEESGSAQSSPPSPTLSILSLPFEGPPPPRRREHIPLYRHFCECDRNGNHDDIYPLSLKDYPPFQKDYLPWPFLRGNVSSHLTSGGAPRTHSPLPLRQHHSADHRQSRRSSSIASTLHSFTEIAEESPPPPPHPEPYGHYSTHFPSAWLLSGAAGYGTHHTKRRLSSASSADPDIGQPPFPAKSKPKPTPPSESPAAISQAKAPSPPPSVASKLPIRESTRQRVEATPAPIIPNEAAKTDVDANAASRNTDKARDLMAELKGERPKVDKGEQIGIWVERVSRHGSFPSSTNDMIMTPLGAGSDEESKAKVVSFDKDIDIDCSDTSGLGDAPHVTQGMHENYSIYSESTNKAEQAAKDD
jgi:hypothetical protein